jgi:uncharacterized protein (DUF342 family)
MDQWFSIKTEQKETSALLIRKNGVEVPSEDITFDALASWIKSKNIHHGVCNEILYQVVQDINAFNFPAEIAKGKLPINGEPAELIPVLSAKDNCRTQTNDKVDFKRLFTIPTVAFGERVARKKLATNGTPGITVFGVAIPAKKGKDITVKNGENTMFNLDDLGVYATASGEVSYKSNCVDVYPVYRVDGDLSLRTGHIDFVGNVHVTGDVPSGFKINAQGDIRIEGLVEAAEIVTPGNIVIGGGVLGQGKGSIRCGGNFTSLYVNQGNIIAGENIEVVQTILYSHCEAGNNIICKNGKGNISGGTSISGNQILANEIGNETNSKTSIFLNTKESTENQIFEGEVKIVELQNSLEKLKQLKLALSNQPASTNKMNAATLPKIENTMNQLTTQLTELYKEKNEHALQNNAKSSFVIINGTLHPNVEITIGKYKRKVQTPFQSAKVYMEEKEIVINSL